MNSHMYMVLGSRAHAYCVSGRMWYIIIYIVYVQLVPCLGSLYIEITSTLHDY